jgi:transposase
MSGSAGGRAEQDLSRQEPHRAADPTGWLMHHRRLARDYETHPHRSEAMINVAMIDLVSRRLTRETTPNWRDA